MDIAALKEAAEKATQGPWVYPRDASGAPDLAIFSSVKPKSAHSEHGPVIAHVAMADPVTGFLPKGAYDANATYIALANPTAILSLIERVAALEEAMLDARAKLEPFAQVAHIFRDREPQHGDIIQGWEFSSGSAELRVSHCRDAAKTIAKIDAALSPTNTQAD